MAERESDQAVQDRQDAEKAEENRQRQSPTRCYRR